MSGAGESQPTSGRGAAAPVETGSRVRGTSRRLRVAALFSLTLAVLALAVIWARHQKRVPTPAECLDAYYEAGRGGDGGRYLRCLAEPLRSQTSGRWKDPQGLAASLRETMKDIKAWVQHGEPVLQGSG